MPSRQLRISPQCQRHNARSHTAHHPRTKPACRNARAQSRCRRYGQSGKISRPTVDEGISLEDWLYFEQRWQEYKDATSVAGLDQIYQLLDCCNPDGLRRNLVRVHMDTLASCNEYELLANIKKMASHEEVMAFVESKESGKLSLQQLNGGSVAAAPVSSFRKQQREMFKQQTPPTPLLTPTCTHCGQVGHGSSRDERSDNCAAYSQICTKCGKRGHYAAIAAVFQSLCSVASAQPIDDNEIICNLWDFELEHCIYCFNTFIMYLLQEPRTRQLYS